MNFGEETTPTKRKVESNPEAGNQFKLTDLRLVLLCQMRTEKQRLVVRYITRRHRRLPRGKAIHR